MSDIVVSSGETVSGLTVASMIVQSGGTAIDTTVISGGEQDVDTCGGLAIGTTVSSGLQFVFSAGVASNTTLSSQAPGDSGGRRGQRPQCRGRQHGPRRGHRHPPRRRRCGRQRRLRS